MKIATIHGSAREDGANAYALAIIHDELKALDIEIIDIHPSKMALNMPFMGDSPDAPELKNLIKSADGIILNTPEYHGSFSSLMKMTIENMGHPSALLKKPVSLFGLAGGAIGAVKSLEHLASVCRHTGAIVMPKYVSVPFADKAFDSEGNITDEIIDNRLRQLVRELIQYLRETTRPSTSYENVVRDNAI